ncbi:uncharacterized protein LOC135372149 [Ornithodoros turicata]|uniref:uncharacterized protein LOC135372149 n=1 Tax=Ornithodoros turicata TaxID=34597 RepID=UPI003139D01E
MTDDVRNDIAQMKTQIRKLMDALNIRANSDTMVTVETTNDCNVTNDKTGPPGNDVNVEQPNVSGQLLAATPGEPTHASAFTPSMTDILTVLVDTQRRIADAVTQASRPLEVHSTNDTANAIPTFDGDPHNSVTDWLQNVELVASHAHWTPSLTMLSVFSRLRGAAQNWQRVYGTRFHDWNTWKIALSERFKRKLTLQEFIEYQSQRKLQQNETMVEYIYAKNAMLEKAPYTLAAEERISLIINGIKDDRWAVPLAAQRCTSVLELIDRAATLDSRRQTHRDNVHLSRTSTPNLTNPDISQPRPNSDGQTRSQQEPKCFNCSELGHISRHCPKPKSAATLRAEVKRRQPSNEHQPRRDTTHNTSRVNCFINTTSNNLPLIKAMISGNTLVNACIDTGANVSVVKSSVIPPNVATSPWSSQERVTVIDKELIPDKVTELDIIVGTTKTRLPNIIVSPLPDNVDLLLGSDWRQLANVDVTFHNSNDVTIVHLLEDGAATSICDSPSSKGELRQSKTAQALVASFCSRELPMHSSSDTNIVSIRHKRNAPDPAVQSEINKAVDHMTPDATEEEQNRLRELLTTHHEAFATTEDSVGACPHTEHSIELRDNIPVASRPYRCSPADRDFIRSQVQEYLNKDIIRASESEYAAPTIVVDQPQHPTNPRRMVHDYRRLNAKTISTPYPMPVMEDVIDDVMRNGAVYFTVMDVKSAFLTIRIKDDDIHKTAPDNHQRPQDIPVWS